MANSRAQEVRIIGGKWKGRKLRFARRGDLRPTPARTRETLFNWLRADLAGSRCLDLFAGSGVLGFEALSQGAASLTSVDRDARVAGVIRAQATSLAAEVSVRNTDALRFLRTCREAFDIIFIDPPYRRHDLLERSLALISERALCNKFVYAESDSAERLEAIAAKHGFTVARQTRAGDANAVLLSPPEA